MEPDLLGAPFREYPRTFTTKNWPFTALLVFISGIMALTMYSTGYRQGAAYWVVGIVPGTAIAVTVGLRLLELWQPRVAGIYENGLVVDYRGEERFLPWNQIEWIRSRSTYRWSSRFNITTRLDIPIYEINYQDGLRVRVSSWKPGGDVLPFIAAHSPVEEKYVPSRWWET